VPETSTKAELRDTCLIVKYLHLATTVLSTPAIKELLLRV